MAGDHRLIARDQDRVDLAELDDAHRDLGDLRIGMCARILREAKKG